MLKDVTEHHIPRAGKASMKQPQKTKIDEFKAHFRGDVLLPGDAGYDDVREIWNAMIDRRPALIARCVSPEDIVQAVKFARQHNLLISVRGGGHNIAGHAVCDDGVMIDLSLMKSVQDGDDHERVDDVSDHEVVPAEPAAPDHALVEPEHGHPEEEE